MDDTTEEVINDSTVEIKLPTAQSEKIGANEPVEQLQRPTWTEKGKNDFVQRLPEEALSCSTHSTPLQQGKTTKINDEILSADPGNDPNLKKRERCEEMEDKDDLIPKKRPKEFKTWFPSSAHISTVPLLMPFSPSPPPSSTSPSHSRPAPPSLNGDMPLLRPPFPPSFPPCSPPTDVACRTPLRTAHLSKDGTALVWDAATVLELRGKHRVLSRALGMGSIRVSAVQRVREGGREEVGEGRKGGREKEGEEKPAMEGEVKKGRKG